MFVLPNLFTVTSIFCGFYALTLVCGEARPDQLYQAALAIFFAMFFDGFDGRVARLTRTQSQFGMELDSLADVISFGVVPGLLVHKWALAPLGLAGLLIAFAFTACGALRLARFNVIAQRSGHGGASRFFVGLPIPLAAGVLISMVIAHHVARGGPLEAEARVPITFCVAALALLMVSTVRYRTFKDFKLNRVSLSVFALLAGTGVWVAVRLHPAFILVVYFSFYLLLGLAESSVLLVNFLVRRPVASPAAPADGEEDPVEEEEGDAELEGEEYF